MDSLLRELKFALRDRVELFAVVGVALLSVYSVNNGLKQTSAERATIERVTKMVNDDRAYYSSLHGLPGDICKSLFRNRMGCSAIYGCLLPNYPLHRNQLIDCG